MDRNNVTMKRTRRQFLKATAATAVAAFALAGCARGDAGAETANDGGERIAAIGLGDVDTLLALGITPVIVAPWGPPGDVDEKGVGPWAEDALGDARPELVHGTGSGFTAEIIERITAAQPTKIIAVNAAVDERAKKDLEAIAPVTLHPEEYADWQVPWEVQVRTIAGAVGKEAEGSELIDRTNQAFADFRADHPDIDGKTAAIVIPYEGKIGLYTEDDGRGQFIENLGYTIPDDLQTTDDGAFYKDFAPENYSQLDQVDTLFVIDYEGGAETLRRDPTFSALKILRENRVRYLEVETGKAMSTPNPITIPWALDKVAGIL